MDQLIEHLLEQYTLAQRELGKILESGRHIADHLSRLAQKLPQLDESNWIAEEGTEETQKMAKQISAYLNGLSDLEDALNQKMKTVLAELPEEEAE